MLFSIQLFAGEDSGRISLIFNGERIDVPVANIVVKKNDKVSLNVSAFLNKEEIFQEIVMEMSFNGKLPEKEDEGFDPEGFMLNIRTRDNKDLSGKELQVKMNGGAHYSYYKKDQRSSSDFGNMKYNVRVNAARYEKGHLIITGELSGEFGLYEDKNEIKHLAEVKDGKFTLII
jgi:beta-glucosidase/6-phospho-beta-glucosidase/beta-galactosidase